MTKDHVLEVLSQINYPGFTRDIVSFGLVDNVSISGNTIHVSLKLSANQAKQDEIKTTVENKLKSLDVFQSINVSIAGTVQPKTNVLQSLKPRSVNRIIAVASGKGGVGKSTIAANLACSFLQNGYKVGLLDLDIYGPSLPIILGINESPHLTQEKKLIPLEWNGLKVMSFGFISGNDSPTIWRGPLVARMTEQFFKDVSWGDLDYLILDLPPGTGDIQLTLTQKIQISGAVIVTTPQDIALSDVRKGADMFRKVNTPVLGVVENMSGFVLNGTVRDEMNKTLSKTTINFEDGHEIITNEEGAFQLTVDMFKKGGGEKESLRLGVPLLGKIPLSKSIMDSTDAGTPLAQASPNSTYSKMFQQITSKIIDEL